MHAQAEMAHADERACTAGTLQVKRQAPQPAVVWSPAVSAKVYVGNQSRGKMCKGEAPVKERQVRLFLLVGNEPANH